MESPFVCVDLSNLLENTELPKPKRTLEPLPAYVYQVMYGARNPVGKATMNIHVKPLLFANSKNRFEPISDHVNSIVHMGL
jgi:hypothetical protein